jgi:hypothetical protein
MSHSQFDPEYGTPVTNSIVTGATFDMTGPLEPDAATDAASILIIIQVWQNATNTVAVGQNTIAPVGPRWECPMTVLTGGFTDGPATGTASTVEFYEEKNGVEHYHWTANFTFIPSSSR